jgi:hypothetical protein
VDTDSVLGSIESVCGLLGGLLRGLHVQVSPGEAFFSLLFTFCFIFPILYSAFNSNFNCRFLTLLIPLSCITVIIKPFFLFGTSILYLSIFYIIGFIQIIK